MTRPATKPPWRTPCERAAALREEADRFCADFKLREFEEGERFGRYYMRGRYSWAEVITVRGGVIVCGDVETVHFAYYSGHPDSFPRGPLYWMSTTSYGYAAEKAKIGGGLEREWDEHLAREAVRDWVKDDTIDAGQAAEIVRAIAEGQSSFQEAVRDETADFELVSAGESTSYAVFTACAILARLCAELEAKDFRESSREWFGRAA